LIPDDYLPDINTRLVLYKRIAAAANEEELREIHVEMIDRFGLLPQPCRNLFHTTETKLVAAALGISKIDVGERGGNFEFADQTQVNPMSLVKLVQEQPQVFRLTNGNRLRFDCELDDFHARLEFVEELLKIMAVDSTEAAA
jgi:transcription-repair coupling factor (superfamily II helicase)